MTRQGGRKTDELRVWKIVPRVLDHAEGSALIEAGKTKVICAASVEERLPPFLKNGDQGWVTAEYSMLPRSTHTRSPRERGGRIGGRTLEIQRMIGRSLRSVIDLKGIPNLTVTVDCDVIQADGGTRTASVTAAWVALNEALEVLTEQSVIPSNPILDNVAGLSVGVVKGRLVLDLDYAEDSVAEVDMNVVFTGRGKLVEVQATAEGAPFSVARLNSLLKLAQKGVRSIFRIQREALRGAV